MTGSPGRPAARALLGLVLVALALLGGCVGRAHRPAPPLPPRLLRWLEHGFDPEGSLRVALLYRGARTQAPALWVDGRRIRGCLRIPATSAQLDHRRDQGPRQEPRRSGASAEPSAEIWRMACRVPGLEVGEHRVLVSAVRPTELPARERGLGLRAPVAGPRPGPPGSWWSTRGWSGGAPLDPSLELATWVRRPATNEASAAPSELSSWDPRPGLAIAAFIRGDSSAEALAEALLSWERAVADEPGASPLIGFGEAGGDEGLLGLTDDQRRLAWALLLSSPGRPIFPPEEPAAPGPLLPTFRWLSATRRAHPALRSGRSIVLEASGDRLALLKILGDDPVSGPRDLVLLCANRGRDPWAFRPPLHPSLTRVSGLRDSWDAQTTGFPLLRVPPRGIRLEVAGPP